MNKFNKFALPLVLFASFGFGSANAEDIYYVVRVEPATKVVEVPVRVCQNMGSHGAPMCEDFNNKTRVPAEGYMVFISNGSKNEKVFQSNEPYQLGTKINIKKDE